MSKLSGSLVQVEIFESGFTYSGVCKKCRDKKSNHVVAYSFLRDGAGEGTRTLTPKAQEPKSCASTNFATPAEWDQHNLNWGG